MLLFAGRVSLYVLSRFNIHPECALPPSMPKREPIPSTHCKQSYASSSCDRQCVIWSRARGVPAIAINFGPFKDVGMAATYADSMLAVGLTPLHPTEACRAFENVGLASQLVYGSISIKVFRKVNTTKGSWPFVEYLHHRPLLSSENICTPVDTFAKGAQLPRASLAITDMETLLELVKDEVTRVLGQEIAVADHFAQHSIDSLAALELSTALSKSIGKELPGTLVFDYPSVKDLAQHLHNIVIPKDEDRGLLETHAALVVPSYKVEDFIGLRIASRLPARSSSKCFNSDAIIPLPYPRYATRVLIMHCAISKVVSLCLFIHH